MSYHSQSKGLLQPHPGQINGRFTCSNTTVDMCFEWVAQVVVNILPVEKWRQIKSKLTCKGTTLFILNCSNHMLPYIRTVSNFGDLNHEIMNFHMQYLFLTAVKGTGAEYVHTCEKSGIHEDRFLRCQVKCKAAIKLSNPFFLHQEALGSVYIHLYVRLQ